MTARLTALALLVIALHAQTPGEVLVVVNKRSRDSREIGEYYLKKRAIPPANLCTIDTAPNEAITRAVYDRDVRAPIGEFLQKHGLVEKILYIVTTAGVPLKVIGNADGLRNTGASVDSELTVLYEQLHGGTIPLPGMVRNPFYQQRDTPFRHPFFPMYLVTRLEAYDIGEMKGLVDRALIARNTGKFVIDARADESTPGNQWLRTAALLLPKDRVVLNNSAEVLANQKDVIGYASWGSNDPDRKHRFLHFQWLPGAIMTEFVSTNGRTFERPPDNWQIGAWKDHSAWFAGAPQTLTADYIHEGATGASGQVDEPFLGGCPRPDYVLPAYYSGRTLAESYYSGIPGLSWMNIVIGDPLTRLPR
ncbi:MAG TPA: TIGR03790 family protein [Bryobacteraceae bacterium]|nr:TIGR03790 family protein [Bryobacteraceae bacterium]